MNETTISAEGLKVAVIHGGDAAGHERRLQDWLEQHGAARIVDIRFCVVPEQTARSSVGYSTMVLYRED